jgi:hypothetical protein
VGKPGCLPACAYTSYIIFIRTRERGRENERESARERDIRREEVKERERGREGGEGRGKGGERESARAREREKANRFAFSLSLSLSLSHTHTHTHTHPQDTHTGGHQAACQRANWKRRQARLRADFAPFSRWATTMESEKAPIESDIAPTALCQEAIFFLVGLRRPL